MTKKILYVDMDGVLVDFQSGIDSLSKEEKKEYEGRYDEVDGIFGLMKPMKGAIEAFEKLSKVYDVYILSTAPWANPSSLSHKLIWVKTYLPKSIKRLILSHQKHLNIGDYLIDDRPTKNGADKFTGQLIPFSHEGFETWEKVVEYLLTKDGFK